MCLLACLCLCLCIEYRSFTNISYHRVVGAETFELLRLLRFLRRRLLLTAAARDIELPEEFMLLCIVVRKNLVGILNEYGSSLVHSSLLNWRKKNSSPTDADSDGKVPIDSESEEVTLPWDVLIPQSADIEGEEVSSYSYNLKDEFVFWNEVNAAKERYRERTEATFSGETITRSPAELIYLVDLMLLKVKSGIHQAMQSVQHMQHPLSPSYFHYDCHDFAVNSAKAKAKHDEKRDDWKALGAGYSSRFLVPPGPIDHRLLSAAKTSPHPKVDVSLTGVCSRVDLPIFLEGVVRHLKTAYYYANDAGTAAESTDSTRRNTQLQQQLNQLRMQGENLDDMPKGSPLAIYRSTKKSNIYDKKLKMYKISESLTKVSPNVGRLLAFSPGWLENESIWLHMQYKYYLELLRNGLYHQFYEEISTGLVPFMDPEVYGRSPLEASSFIVSSAFQDEKVRGSGFLARLSGATAEFISMWNLMTVGPAPFTAAAPSYQVLSFKLQPALAASLFHNETNTLSFTFLGCINVTYFNPTRQDTWKLTPASYRINMKSDFAPNVLHNGVVAHAAHPAEAPPHPTTEDPADDAGAGAPKRIRFIANGAEIKGDLARYIRSRQAVDMFVTLH